MAKEKKKVPNLRFKGFTDDWEQRKLKEVSSFENGRAYKQNELLESGKYPVLRVGNFYTNSQWYYSNIELSENKYASDGDLLYTWSATFGPHIWHGPKVIYHYHIWKIDISNKINKLFLYSFLEEDRANLLNNTNGSTMIHITKSNMENKSIMYPSVKEQSDIGRLFYLVNNLVTLQQRKLDLLKQLKNGLLQKMFANKGSKQPVLRFKGFHDDWEQRKLSELIQKGGSGGTPKSTNKAYYNGNIPFLGISDISKSNGYIDDTEKYISEKGLDNSSAWIVPKGAISLAMYASVGKLAILNTDAATSQAFYNMVFEDVSIRDYVYHRLGKANEFGEWTRLISTGTQSNLNADKVKNFRIQVPQIIDEIKNISTFFNQLDSLIALHQRKQNHLKLLKKSLLQQMFM